MSRKYVLLAAIVLAIISQSRIVSAASQVTGSIGADVASPSSVARKADAPTSLYIPKIKRAIPVIPVGLSSAGAIDVPHNFVQAGWYRFGAVPGEIGSAIIDGHVDNGGDIPGVFKNLKELAYGDDVYIADASGKILHFKVTDASVYKRTASMNSILASRGKPVIRIITCYGRFLPSIGTYDRRLVVTAELVA